MYRKNNMQAIYIIITLRASVCVSVCVFANSSETNERTYAKFAQMMENISGSAQKNFGDLMSKIKVTRGQKVTILGYRTASDLASNQTTF